MIVLLLLGLLLFGTAVVLVTRGVIDARLRTMDTLGQIGHYGFAGTVELEPHPGFRGFLDSAASSVGVLLTEKVNIISEDRLRKNLIAAGMYQTTPRQVIGYSLLCALVFPALGIWLTIAAGLLLLVDGGALGWLFALGRGR